MTFLIFVANAPLSRPPTISARLISFAIWTPGTVYLDDVRDAARHGHQERVYWMWPSKSGKMASLFPIVTPVVVAPLYGPAVAYLHLADWTAERLPGARAV